MKLDSAAFIADQELVQALKRRAKPVDCTKEVVLFHQGDAADGLYIIHTDGVTVTMTSAADELLISIPVGPGSLLGLPGLVGNSPYTLSAAARKGSEISFVGKDEFSRLMLTDPALSIKILQVLAAEVRSARQAISSR